MEANDCMPDDVTYNTLIRGCFHNKKYNKASVLMDQMSARRFSADASTVAMFVVKVEFEELDVLYEEASCLSQSELRNPLPAGKLSLVKIEA
ncbi:hypothetical protein AgCh_001094 [Apium graveolens]